MNAMHLELFLEKHSAGWKPFKGDFGLSKQSLKNIGQGAVAYGKGFIGGSATAGATTQSEVQKQEIARDESSTQEKILAAKKAAHDAEVAGLAKRALGSVALRRRRGSMATMLTGSPLRASSPSTTGKTLLSQ